MTYTEGFRHSEGENSEETHTACLLLSVSKCLYRQEHFVNRINEYEGSKDLSKYV